MSEQAPAQIEKLASYFALDDFLSATGVSHEKLLVAIVGALPIEDDDAVLLSGSVTERLATSYSDIDVLVVTRHSHVLGAIDNGKFLNFRGLRLDVKAVAIDEVDHHIARVSEWIDSGANSTKVNQFGFQDMVLLLRLTTSVSLRANEAVQGWKQRSLMSDLSTVKLADAVRSFETGQVDLVGLAADQDWSSLVYNASRVLDYGFDAVLAGFGEPNRSPKWRPRLLRRLPVHWADGISGQRIFGNAVDFLFQLSRPPTTLNAQSCLAYACKIVTWVRRAVPSAHAGFRPPTLPTPQQAISIPETPTTPLPCLDLDVSVRWTGSVFEVFRAQARKDPIRLDWKQFDILAHFDGQSPTQLEHYPQEEVDQILSLVRWAGLARRHPYPHL